MILPTQWRHGKLKPVCIHLAGTGDHVSVGTWPCYGGTHPLKAEFSVFMVAYHVSSAAIMQPELPFPPTIANPPPHPHPHPSTPAFHLVFINTLLESPAGVAIN